MKSDNKELQVYAADTLKRLNEQSELFTDTAYEENRRMGMVAAAGTLQQVEYGFNAVKIRQGESRNRFTGNTAPEHTLQLSHVQNLGMLGLNPQSRVSEGRVDFLSGEASFSTYSSANGWPNKVKGVDAWQQIQPMLHDIQGTFLTPFDINPALYYPYPYPSPYPQI